MKVILIIDDDRIIGERLRERLENLDYQVILITSTDDGLDWLKKNDPDLFLFDCNMSICEGIEFITELMSYKGKLPPFIAFSVIPDLKSVVEIMKLGALDFIPKDGSFIDNVTKSINTVFRKIDSGKLKDKQKQLTNQFYQLTSQIIHNVNAGIVVYDKDLKYKMWNPYMERMTGLPASSVIGRNSLEIFPFLVKANAESKFKSILNGHAPFSFDLEFYIQETNKSGWASNFLAPLFDDEGNIEGVVSSILNITNRKKVEQDLIINKNKLKQVLDLLPYHIYLKDNNGSFILANRSVAQLYGESSHSLIGLKDVYFNNPNNEILSCDSDDTGKITKEEILAIEGKKRIFKTTLLPFIALDNRSTAELGISIDITKEKEDEELIKRLSMAVEQSANSIIFTDSNGKIKYTNPRFSEITGYSADEVRGLNPRFLNSGKQPKEYFSNIWDTIRQGKPWKGELYNRTKDGRYIWEQATIFPVENEKGKIINFMAIEEDITTLKENELQLENLINNIPDTVAYKDKNKRWIKINQAALSLFELEGVDYRGKTALELAEHSKFFSELMNKSSISDELAFQSKNPYTQEIVIRLRDGRHKIYEFKKVPIFNTDNSRKGLVVIGRDITEQINKEKELIRAKEKAELNDRLKSSFLQNISHEIRTPMNAIMGFSKLLNQLPSATEKQKQFTSIIMNNSNQLLAIVTNILTISSLETHQENIFERKVNINSLLSGLFSSFKIQAEMSGIDLLINMALDNGNADIFTDKAKLLQVLNNLLNNAFKFTLHGEIEFGYGIISSENSLSKFELIFYVKDSGIGIHEKWLSKIFDPFVQSDLLENRKYGGNGIGLSISKGFVELLGGKIWVESILGEGSIFYFTIPYKPVNENISINMELISGLDKFCHLKHLQFNQP